MVKRFFSPMGLWQQSGLTFIRILIGLFMTYHGWEVFDAEKMSGYAKWLTELNFPSPLFMAYVGKASEWISGILLTLGLFTRIASVVLSIIMSIITFGIGEGRIFMQEQHPFLFVLFAFVFFFTGPGKWSFDYIVFANKTSKYPPDSN